MGQAEMLRLRAEEVASSTRANLEVSTLGKAAAGNPAAKKMTSRPKKSVVGGRPNLQPGDFGYGDPLQGKRFGGTTELMSGLGKPATDYSRVPSASTFKADTDKPSFFNLFSKPKDKEGTKPGDFGYGDIMKG